jgi:hypothetical protein
MGMMFLIISQTTIPINDWINIAENAIELNVYMNVHWNKKKKERKKEN